MSSNANQAGYSTMNDASEVQAVLPDNADVRWRKLDEDTLVFEKPFLRGIIPIGGRSTAIRLTSSTSSPSASSQARDVFVLASTPCTEQTAALVRSKLGEVQYIFGADAVHWLFLKEWKQRFSGAKVIGVKALDDMRSKVGVSFDYVYGADASDARANPLDAIKDEIEVEYFGSFQNKDVAIWHRPSKTLLEADLLFNLPANQQYEHVGKSASFFGLAKYLNPYTTLHRFFMGLLISDKQSFGTSAKRVASWNVDRIIPCHGDVIETGGAAAWRRLYGKYIESVERSQ